MLIVVGYAPWNSRETWALSIFGLKMYLRVDEFVLGREYNVKRAKGMKY